MTSLHNQRRGILLLSCPDQKGLVAAISTFLFQHSANILDACQHQDPQTGTFLMRIEWDPQESLLNQANFSDYFLPLARRFSMTWQLAFSDVKPKIAIFVSQYDHCLADLLYRNRIGELACKIELVISNHPQSRELTQFYGIPFHQIEVNSQNKRIAEAQQLELLSQHSVELVVLARYMQILTPEFVKLYPNQIINIHHSFLPAFQGAKPYHQAFARGVKLIGATSHYVTEGLDEGPIIQQDVTHISHRDSVEHLVQKGRNLETLVLSCAVKWHLERRIVVCGNKTVVLN